MSHELVQFGLTAFVTLMVVVDPLGVVPVFVAPAEGMSQAERRKSLVRAVSISFCVAVFFLLAGRAML